MMTPKEHLQAALEKLGPNGEHWKQNWLAYDKDGNRVMERDPAAVSWCLAGAMLATATQTESVTGAWNDTKEWDALHAAQKSFVQWQDEAGRTFPEVKHLFEKAIAFLEAV